MPQNRLAYFATATHWRLKHTVLDGWMAAVVTGYYTEILTSATGEAAKLTLAVITECLIVVVGCEECAVSGGRVFKASGKATYIYSFF